MDVDENPALVALELDASRTLRRPNHLQAIVINIDEDVIHERVVHPRRVA